MSSVVPRARRFPFVALLDTAGAWTLAVVWIAPLLFAVWAACHTAQATLTFDWHAPLTTRSFATAWHAAPWLRYFFNTVVLTTMILCGQLVICTFAGFAFARLEMPFKDVLFGLVLVQLFVLPEVLILENYRMVTRLGLFDSYLGTSLPYMASAFGIFLLRQAFRQVPRELDEAARIEGCSWFGVMWRVYVPAVKPTYLAYALVSVSAHWNSFLWPLVVTNSAATRPITVGLSLFGAPENGVDISVISAGTLLTIAPLTVGFLIFQRQFIQAFLRAGIK
ncbi:carbohydrate ABC transporter permease [Robbsia sp. KACC 23696]|uniref:carbohydrate ABC transporter permease n=1 Tax=Robbsia sp. KACC 23696 TaxID=3149231 RepID=UPI00325C199E